MATVTTDNVVDEPEHRSAAPERGIEPLIPELAAPPAQARPRTLVTGTVLGAGAVAMVFAAMLGFYLHGPATIAGGDDWLPRGVNMPLTPANMALVTLLMSAVIMQWAVYTIGIDDRRSTYIALGLAVLMGCAYLNEIAFFYSQMGRLTVHEPVGMLIFGISGAHLVMAGIAILFVLITAFRTFGGQYSAHDREGIVAATLFWDVMVSVYAAIWLIIFVTK